MSLAPLLSAGKVSTHQVWRRWACQIYIQQKKQKRQKTKNKKDSFRLSNAKRKFINMFDHGRILTNENWTIFIPQFFSLKLKLKVGHKSLRRSL
jgi:hypothetical protein